MRIRNRYKLNLKKILQHVRDRDSDRTRKTNSTVVAKSNITELHIGEFIIRTEKKLFIS